MRIVLFFFVIIGMKLLLACQNDVREVERVAGKKESFATISGKEVDMDYLDSGLVRLKLHAGTLKRFEFNVKEPYYEIDSGLKIIFFDKDGKEISTLSSRYGIYYETTKRVEVRYNVVVTNREGKRLETEKLSWRENDSIRNEGDAYLIENDRRMHGKKLIASNDFSHMELEDYVIQIPVETFEKEEQEKP
jgi:LPS export ABC transporter protein LptC